MAQRTEHRHQVVKIRLRIRHADDSTLTIRELD
jgi:hypothetical protein